MRFKKLSHPQSCDSLENFEKYSDVTDRELTSPDEEINEVYETLFLKNLTKHILNIIEQDETLINLNKFLPIDSFTKLLRFNDILLEQKQILSKTLEEKPKYSFTNYGYSDDESVDSDNESMSSSQESTSNNILSEKDKLNMKKILNKIYDLETFIIKFRHKLDYIHLNDYKLDSPLETLSKLSNKSVRLYNLINLKTGVFPPQHKLHTYSKNIFQDIQQLCNTIVTYENLSGLLLIDQIILQDLNSISVDHISAMLVYSRFKQIRNDHSYFSDPFKNKIREELLSLTMSMTLFLDKNLPEDLKIIKNINSIFANISYPINEFLFEIAEFKSDLDNYLEDHPSINKISSETILEFKRVLNNILKCANHSNNKICSADELFVNSFTPSIFEAETALDKNKFPLTFELVTNLKEKNSIYKDRTLKYINRTFEYFSNY